MEPEAQTLLQKARLKIIKEIIPKIIDVKREIGINKAVLNNHTYINRANELVYRNAYSHYDYQDVERETVYSSIADYVYSTISDNSVLMFGKELIDVLKQLYLHKEEIEKFISIGVPQKKQLLIEKICENYKY